MSGIPNPASDSYLVRFLLGSPQRVSLTVTESSGRVVAEIPEEYARAGIHEQRLDVSQLPNGVYLLQMKSASGLGSEPVKMVVQR